eukprot:1151879-Rhodomonas_salina.1
MGNRSCPQPTTRSNSFNSKLREQLSKPASLLRCHEHLAKEKSDGGCEGGWQVRRRKRRRGGAAGKRPGKTGSRGTAREGEAGATNVKQG